MHPLHVFRGSFAAPLAIECPAARSQRSLFLLNCLSSAWLLAPPLRLRPRGVASASSGDPPVKPGRVGSGRVLGSDDLAARPPGRPCNNPSRAITP